MEIKGFIKINKYYLKRQREAYSKNTRIYIKPFVICSKIYHTQIPHHVATSELNRNKNQVIGFHKMPDARAWNLKTDSRNKGY